ncbi:MAG: DUF6677 family protein [Bryocella sp.]
MATDAQLTQPLPGERPATPVLALLLGWLIPGAGHLLTGRYVRAALLFAAILGMYLTGLALSGQLYTTASGEILDILSYVGQLGLGLLYFIARWSGWGATSVVTTIGDYGTKFLIVGGLLNIISAVDAYSLANGRKALK